jgi:hypothetical protein
VVPVVWVVWTAVTATPEALVRWVVLELKAPLATPVPMVMLEPTVWSSSDPKDPRDPRDLRESPEMLEMPEYHPNVAHPDPPAPRDPRDSRDPSVFRETSVARARMVCLATMPRTAHAPSDRCPDGTKWHIKENFVSTIVYFFSTIFTIQFSVYNSHKFR